MPTCCSETMSKIQPGSFWSNRTADGKDFKNIGHELPRQGNAAFLKWQLQRIGLDKTPEGGYEGFGERYFHPCNMGEVLQQIRAEEKPVGDCVFWIGHASALLCLERGLNILFDPIFSKRASPFSFAGPKRRYPPATQIDELPPIHVITLSHNHYDHLDSASCKALYRRFPDVHFVVPVDLDKHLLKWGIPESSITVLDYWEECVIDGVVISCTAAYHWGLRTGFDRNETLWCGWAIGWPRNNKEEDAESSSFTHDDTATGNMNMSGGDLTQTPLMLSTPGSTPVSGVALSATEENSEFIKYATESNVDWSKLKSYYFTGDTAFSADVFRAIHHRYHHFDMAALPIGAYKPRQFLETMHVAPIDSVRIFKMLHVKRAFGVHFGTFELADDPVDEPLGLLQEALLEEGVSEKDFITIPMGEYIEF